MKTTVENSTAIQAEVCDHRNDSIGTVWQFTRPVCEGQT